MYCNVQYHPKHTKDTWCCDAILGNGKISLSDDKRFMADFAPLTELLHEWFDTCLDDLPEQLRVRVTCDLMPLPWDKLSPEQRRHAALQWDYLHDPEMEQDREHRWNLATRISAIKDEIDEWKLKDTPTAMDLELKKKNLVSLENELAVIERQFDHSDRGNKSLVPTEHPSSDYIAAPAALNCLKQRLHATVDNLAGWVWQGSDDGGLAAYHYKSGSNQLTRFYYDVSDGQDYLMPLMRCWFLKEEIENFEPGDYYLSGRALIEEWRSLLGTETEAFISAKIVENRLFDIHPTYGETQGSNPEEKSLPPLEAALFLLSQIKNIESRDFAYPVRAESSEDRVKRLRIWYAEEMSKRKRGALQRTADREGIARQTLRGILDRK